MAWRAKNAVDFVVFPKIDFWRSTGTTSLSSCGASHKLGTALKIRATSSGKTGIDEGVLMDFGSGPNLATGMDLRGNETSIYLIGAMLIGSFAGTTGATTGVATGCGENRMTRS